jgi:hypothetical protein
MAFVAELVLAPLAFAAPATVAVTTRFFVVVTTAFAATSVLAFAYRVVFVQTVTTRKLVLLIVYCTSLAGCTCLLLVACLVVGQ